MKWLPLLLGGAPVLLFTVDQTLQRTRLDAFIERLDHEPLAAAKDLAATADHSCPQREEDAEYFRLAQALFAIEMLATSRSERIVESVITRLFWWIGRPGPDFSIGDGQIRISVMQKGLRNVPEQAQPPWGEDGPSALDLFDRCRALVIASRLIRYHVRAKTGSDGLLMRSEVERVAKFWNGQKRAKTKDAVLAGLRYRELVYRTFMVLRFRSRKGRASAATE